VNGEWTTILYRCTFGEGNYATSSCCGSSLGKNNITPYSTIKACEWILVAHGNPCYLKCELTDSTKVITHALGNAWRDGSGIPRCSPGDFYQGWGVTTNKVIFQCNTMVAAVGNCDNPTDGTNNNFESCDKSFDFYTY
jgi:hypothetical protein